MVQLAETATAMPVAVNLTTDQQAAYDAIFQFLLGDEREFVITGAGGVGKTFLMGQIIDSILPHYKELCQLMGQPIRYHEAFLTATTNKAAAQLAEDSKRICSTVHSHLGLTMRPDYTTGQTRLKRGANWSVKENQILIVDECSMVDTQLYKAIQEGLINSKVIYVGDQHQLAPVMEVLSPVFRNNLPMVELMEPVRNVGQPALMDLCAHFRATVQTGVFPTVHLTPGVVDYYTREQIKEHLDVAFQDPNHNSKIVAYTNKQVVSYNDYIRHLRNLPDTYTEGEHLILNNVVPVSNGIIPTESEIEIVNLSGVQTEHLADDITIDYRDAGITANGWTLPKVVRIPVDGAHALALQRYFGANGNWPLHFHMRDKYLDLRPRDASTVHKAQGATYDTVIIDLSDISTCTHKDQVARMLYVAVSRARNRVIFHGKLSDRFFV
jgi:nucleoside-triphosphatase THEP1